MPSSTREAKATEAEESLFEMIEKFAKAETKGKDGTYYYDVTTTDKFRATLIRRLRIIADSMVPIEQAYAFGDQKKGSDVLRMLYKRITGEDAPKGMIEVW